MKGQWATKPHVAWSAGGLCLSPLKIMARTNMLLITANDLRCAAVLIK